jgi:hypothetical protein
MEREAKGFQDGTLRAFMHQVHAKKRKEKATLHRQDVEITRLCEMGDKFPETGSRNPFHHEVFVIDVILNCADCCPSVDGMGGKTPKWLMPIGWPWCAVLNRVIRTHLLTGSSAP